MENAVRLIGAFGGKRSDLLWLININWTLQAQMLTDQVLRYVTSTLKSPEPRLLWVVDMSIGAVIDERAHLNSIQ